MNWRLIALLSSPGFVRRFEKQACFNGIYSTIKTFETRFLIFMLFLCNLSTGLFAQLPDSTWIQELSWSPDGKRIGFSASKDGIWSTYAVNSDGTNLVKLKENARFVSWSPDGSKIATCLGEEGNWEIYLMSEREAAVRQLTRNLGKNADPSWSPEGSKIAFTSRRDGSSQIYIMNADGSNQLRLTKGPGNYYAPTWSPDGSRIVFYQDKGDGKDQVFVINADGKNMMRVFANEKGNVYPSFFPDGKRVLFTSYTPGNEGFIYTMNLDGSGLASLRSFRGYFARFSPDGKTVALITGTWPTAELHIMNADTTDAGKR